MQFFILWYIAEADTNQMGSQNMFQKFVKTQLRYGPELQ